MKQKIVVRVHMEDGNSRSKALKIAVGLCGVASASIEGADKNEIVVVGDGVDSVTLTRLLRKRFCTAHLLSVAAVEEKQENKEAKEKEKPPESPPVWPPYCPPVYPPTLHCYCEEARDPCRIM